MQHFDLIIVGGGLAGASLALALRDSALRVALVEAQPPRRPDGWDARIYAVSPANVAFLDAIGAWRHLDRQRIAPIAAMKVFGDAGGALEFSAYETGVADLGCILESSLVACELWEGLKRQSNLALFIGQKPAALEFRDEVAVLRLADGETLSAALLVGADGRDSWVREAAGLPAHNRHYGEKGVVANFATDRPHRNIAWQWFGDDGVLAYLPLPGQRMSIVWSAPDALADELCQLSPEALCERVELAGRGVLGKLDLLTPAQAFPLRLMRVPEIVARRLALVGDAGHGIHPLSGHGINLGFQDAQALADRLLASKAWEDIGDLRFLQGYQRARREEITLMQTTTDALRRLFAAPSPLLRPLRNLGLNFTNRLPVAKSVLVRYALGGF
ncbi:UbiH/UbiF family hydroxylase [Azonexus caeni]|uniref:UbiH/UbiF family hydroxylase n=1 Tax=Azonexus caeni TaxID=266126 RepID=UPI003A8763C6